MKIIKHPEANIQSRKDNGNHESWSYEDWLSVQYKQQNIKTADLQTVFHRLNIIGCLHMLFHFPPVSLLAQVRDLGLGELWFHQEQQDQLNTSPNMM